ncbi:MAG: hypothetical protein U9Q62_03530 [Campylobacterota bacterium]|nr:hypothetical protein [Campylobacterota bacterium]
MNDDFIPMIEPTPEPRQKKCKLLVFLIGSGLSYGTFIIALIVWFYYDFFYAFGALLISYLIMGIIRSKLRNSVIPPSQQEYSYSDNAIAAWYVSRRLLCDYKYQDDPV